MTSTGTPTRARRGTAMIVGGTLAVLAIGAVLWFLGGSAPAAVDIDAAAEDVAATSATVDDTTSESVDGTWLVDTTVGEFSVIDTTGTFVGFRIQEELANVGATEAVGRTPEVDGSVTVDGTTLTAAAFTADMTAIVSDEPRRDDKIQEALETSSHPTASFVLTNPVELGQVAEGEIIEVAANGNMTIHGITQPITVPLQAVWQGGTIAVTGSYDITFADYDIAVPTAPVVLSVEDHGAVELQLYLTRG